MGTESRFYHGRTYPAQHRARLRTRTYYSWSSRLNHRRYLVFCWGSLYSNMPLESWRLNKHRYWAYPLFVSAKALIHLEQPIASNVFGLKEIRQSRIQTERNVVFTPCQVKVSRNTHSITRSLNMPIDSIFIINVENLFTKLNHLFITLLCCIIV